MFKIPHSRSAIAVAIVALAQGRANFALADTTYSADATADTFITSYSGQASSDMSSFGAMMISAPVADPQQGISEVRSMESIVGYNTTYFSSCQKNKLWFILFKKIKTAFLIC